MSFKNVSIGFFVSSSLLCLAGTLSYFRTEDLAQKLALSIAVGGGVGAVSSLVLAGSYGAKTEEKIRLAETSFQEEINYKRSELKETKLEMDGLKDQKVSLEKQLLESDFEVRNRDTAIQVLTERIKKIEAEYHNKVQDITRKLSAKDTRVEDFLINFKESMRIGLINKIETLEVLYAEIERKLNDERFTAIHIPLAKRLTDIEKIYARLNKLMEEFERLDITAYETMLDYFWEITTEIAAVKVRYRNSLNSATQQRKDELEELIINSVSHDKVKNALKEYSEFQRQQLDKLNDRVTENNEEWRQLKDALLKDMETAYLEIESLQQKISELEKPLLAVGDSTYARTANRITMYYFDQYKYKLDVIHWTESETGYSILFATRRNLGLTEDELLPENTLEQLAAFTNSLQGTLPKFTFNYQHSTVTLDVTLRKPVKKEQAKGDIDKIWVPVDKFESYVKNWERVRITAGSTGGKSPTAKNLALAIMKTRKGQGEIRLYDPQHGSKKDYWGMPKMGTSHEDNVTGMGTLCTLLDERTKQSGNHPFVLYIFDEVDSTIAQERENNGYYYFRDKVTYSLKQASHQNIGAIYIGQACDASTIPGMSWSDWNNAVQLHIGANAGIFIDKSKTITPEDKTRLLEQYRKIQEYCDRKNEELGLDIFTDPSAYRFALAVPLTGLPKFIQLPDFDSYDYWEVMGEKEAQVSKNTQNTVITNILNEVEKEVENEVLIPTVACPECGSTKLKKNGSHPKNKNLHKYQCKECGHNFTGSIISHNSN